MIISAFGDPGLHAAKELLDVPVVGVSEAAFLAAYMLGNRYSIVCLTPRLKTWYVETAHHIASLADSSLRAQSLGPCPILRGRKMISRQRCSQSVSEP